MSSSAAVSSTNGGPCAVGNTVAVSAGMADRKNEPQSQNEWLSGNTGQTVNDSERGDFYANGRTEKAQGDDEEPEKKVSSQTSGAKRDSYFKKRDY